MDVVQNRCLHHARPASILSWHALSWLKIKARDALQIKSVYYPVMEKLLKKATGASRVHIFDHTLRKGTIKEAK